MRADPKPDDFIGAREYAHGSVASSHPGRNVPSTAVHPFEVESRMPRIAAKEAIRSSRLFADICRQGREHSAEAGIGVRFQRSSGSSGNVRPAWKSSSACAAIRSSAADGGRENNSSQRRSDSISARSQAPMDSCSSSASLCASSIARSRSSPIGLYFTAFAVSPACAERNYVRIVAVAEAARTQGGSCRARSDGIG